MTSPFPKAPRYHIRGRKWRNGKLKHYVIGYDGLLMPAVSHSSIAAALDWLAFVLKMGIFPPPPHHPMAGAMGTWVTMPDRDRRPNPRRALK